MIDDIFSLFADVVAILTFLFSLFLFFKQRKMDKEQEVIIAKQNRLNMGQIEIQIFQMINDVEKELAEVATRYKTDKENLQLEYESAKERYLNTLEEAGSKYIDDKVDKKRFKQNWHITYRTVVESSVYKNKLDPVISKYKCILKLYNEWNNLEL